MSLRGKPPGSGNALLIARTARGIVEKPLRNVEIRQSALSGAHSRARCGGAAGKTRRDFGISEYPHGPFRRNTACFFLSRPVLVNIWGDFGISEYPQGSFRRNTACFFPAPPNTGKYLGRFWNIGISARTFRRKKAARCEPGCLGCVIQQCPRLSCRRCRRPR